MAIGQIQTSVPDCDNALGRIVEAGGRALYPLHEGLLGHLKDWRNEQMNVLRQSRMLTDADQQRWWANLATDERQNLFGIFLEQPPVPIFVGYGGLVNLDRVNSRAELSFLVNPRRVEQADVYAEDMRAAFSMFCWYAFVRLGLNRLFTETFNFRKQHIEVLESLGFKREGTLRQHVMKDGRFWDSELHGLLRSEWEGNLGKI